MPRNGHWVWESTNNASSRLGDQAKSRIPFPPCEPDESAAIKIKWPIVLLSMLRADSEAYRYDAALLR